MALFCIVGDAAALDFDDIAARATDLAQKPYRSEERQPPAELSALTYDQYRDIRFRPDRALWRSENLPFEVRLHAPWVGCDAIALDSLRAEQRVELARQGYAILRGAVALFKAA